MRTTFLLLDFENAQPEGFPAPDGGALRIRVFLGAHQTKVPVTLARALQAFGSHAEYISIAGTGRNDLDFLIACHLGRLTAEHPTARFVIISKDTGFDPLVAHLRSQDLACERRPSIDGFQMAAGDART